MLLWVAAEMPEWRPKLLVPAYLGAFTLIDVRSGVGDRTISTNENSKRLSAGTAIALKIPCARRVEGIVVRDPPKDPFGCKQAVGQTVTLWQRAARIARLP